MNDKNLRTLAVVAAILAVIALLVSLLDGQDNDPEQVFLPGLADNINSISSIEIFSAGDQFVVKLVPADSGWVSESNGGYPADIARVRRNIIALAGRARHGIFCM